ncbi:MAG TPA: hypothetical protein PLZ51_17500, partial [Aggregatilineales bacterium]|nr:hypothetical protein [Aggregatilineales bacterium]
GIFDPLTALMALAWFIIGAVALPYIAWIGGKRLGAPSVLLQSPRVANKSYIPHTLFACINNYIRMWTLTDFSIFIIL